MPVTDFAPPEEAILVTDVVLVESVWTLIDALRAVYTFDQAALDLAGTVAP